MEKEFLALDAIDEIINLITEDKKVKYKAVILFCCNTIKQALIKAQEQEKKFDDFLIFENGHKMSGFDYKGKQIVAIPLEEYDDFMKQNDVLEIIFEKNVDLHYLKDCKTVEEYNKYCDEITEEKELTQKEFDALKRWVENE